VADCTTDLLSATVAEWELPGSKQVLTAIIDSTWLEDLGGNVHLQPGDQVHVDTKREDLVNDYWITRELSTRIAK